MKLPAALLICLLHIVMGNGSMDTTNNHIMDNTQTSFSASQAHLTRSGQVAYAQNRDSYANAAAQAGYSLGSSPTNTAGGNSGNIAAAASSVSAYGVPATASAGGYGNGQAVGTNPQGSMTYYYYHYPAGQQGSNAVGNGWATETTGWGDDDDSFGGGLGGLAGLLGLKGLKGLGGLGLLALLKLLKPLFFPFLLPLLLLLPLLPLLLLFLPIPVITIPSTTTTGRSLESTSVGELISEKVYGGVQTLQNVLGSDQCMERVACEISRRSQGSYLNNVIQGIYNKTETYLSKKLRRGMRAYLDYSSTADSNPSSNCAKFTCEAFKSLTTTTVPTDRRNDKAL